jgi:predicted transposase YbfD/YdcC
MATSPAIIDLLAQIPDPRVEGRCLHKLTDILFIAICTLLSNGEDFEDMATFGVVREDWLRGHLELPNGIPSSDTFNRVFQIIDPEYFNSLMQEDARSVLGQLKVKMLNIDGKKLKGACPGSTGNKGLYLLNAWVNGAGLCAGQSKVDGKSNEITAIPKLLDNLELEESLTTIDAIGCQQDIAKKIIKKKGDYLLSVKKNQKGLFEEMDDAFAWSGAEVHHWDWEYGHGRYEERTCHTMPAKGLLSKNTLDKWTGLETLVRIGSERTVNGVKSCETRYYISSKKETAAFFNAAARGHWGIENQLHWHLDVTFKEDACRARTGNAPENLSAVRKICLRKVAAKKDGLSLKKRRFKASMNTEYLEKILNL